MKMYHLHINHKYTDNDCRDSLRTDRAFAALFRCGADRKMEIV